MGVLDLGGGFGSHYYQVRKAVDKRINLVWDVVETISLAEEARKLNKNDELNYYDSLDELMHKKYDIILSSGTLQYLPDPYDVFKKFRSIDHTYIILNRFR